MPRIARTGLREGPISEIVAAMITSDNIVIWIVSPRIEGDPADGARISEWNHVFGAGYFYIEPPNKMQVGNWRIRKAGWAVSPPRLPLRCEPVPSEELTTFSP